MLRRPIKVKKLKTDISPKRSPSDQQESDSAPGQGLPGQDEQVVSAESTIVAIDKS